MFTFFKIEDVVPTDGSLREIDRYYKTAISSPQRIVEMMCQSGCTTALSAIVSWMGVPPSVMHVVRSFAGGREGLSNFLFSMLSFRGVAAVLWLFSNNSDYALHHMAQIIHGRREAMVFEIRFSEVFSFAKHFCQYESDDVNDCLRHFNYQFACQFNVLKPEDNEGIMVQTIEEDCKIAGIGGEFPLICGQADVVFSQAVVCTELIHAKLKSTTSVSSDVINNIVVVGQSSSEKVVSLAMMTCEQIMDPVDMVTLSRCSRFIHSVMALLSVVRHNKRVELKFSGQYPKPRISNWKNRWQYFHPDMYVVDTSHVSRVQFKPFMEHRLMKYKPTDTMDVMVGYEERGFFIPLLLWGGLERFSLSNCAIHPMFQKNFERFVNGFGYPFSVRVRMFHGNAVCWINSYLYFLTNIREGNNNTIHRYKDHDHYQHWQSIKYDVQDIIGSGHVRPNYDAEQRYVLSKCTRFKEDFVD